MSHGHDRLRPLLSDGMEPPRLPRGIRWSPHLEPPWIDASLPSPSTSTSAREEHAAALFFPASCPSSSSLYHYAEHLHVSHASERFPFHPLLWVLLPSSGHCHAMAAAMLSSHVSVLPLPCLPCLLFRVQSTPRCLPQRRPFL